MKYCEIYLNARDTIMIPSMTLMYLRNKFLEASADVHADEAADAE